MRRRLSFGVRLRGLWWKPDAATEVDDELRHHFDLLVREEMAHGHPRERALVLARARFGDPDAVRRTCERLAESRDRRADVRAFFAGLHDDFRWTLRSLRGSPGYTLAAGSTLGLVVAANALVFTLVWAVLLRPLPYPEPDRLVALNEQTAAGEVWELSLPNLEGLRDGATGIGAFGAWVGNDVTLARNDAPRIHIALVAADFFETLGTGAELGRTLNAQDDHALVLSEGAWRTWLGGDPAVIGTSVRLDAASYTVVGVMPPSFRFPDAGTSAWVTLGPPADWMRNRAVHIFQGVARLKPGITTSRGSAELETVFARTLAAHAGEDPGHALVVRSLRVRLAGNARPTLLLLLASVGAVLLLACVNLAGLTATRAMRREAELALRAALGASRTRLTTQLVVESLLLGTLAGGAGLALAAAVLPAVLRVLPGNLPSLTAIRLDGMVSLVTLAVAMLAGLGIGLVAATRASRADPARQLQGEAGATSRRERLRLQRTLVAAQVAISLVILSGAGLLLRSLREVIHVDPGFRSEGIALATVSLPAERYDRGQTVAWYAGLPERLARIPGIEAVSAVSELPLSGGDGHGMITVEGRPFPAGAEPVASFRRALPNYFHVAGIPLVRGREFDAHDDGQGQMVVIVNAAMANRFWPGEDPIGKRIKVGPPEGEPWLTIVGVVGDVHNETLEAVPGFDTYEPHAQRPRATMSVVVRTAGDALAVLRLLHAALREADPGLPVWDETTMAERSSRLLGSRRFTASVLSGFGGAALLLAAIGIYGVTAYSAARRRREFAIRLALGAGRSRVLGQVLMESVRVVAVGLLIGLPAGLALSRLMRGLLFNVTPADPLSFVLAALALCGFAVLATWLPARQATGSDPAGALRE